MDYPINNRRKPRRHDGVHIIKCIIKSINERFHISPDFLGISAEQYNDFFKQLEEQDYIRRVKEGEYASENYNITLEGIKFLRKKKNTNVEIEQKFNYVLGSTTIKISSQK